MTDFASNLSNGDLLRGNNDTAFLRNSDLPQKTVFESLVSFLFRYVPDVSESTLLEVAEIIVDLANDDSLSDEIRKHNFEEILGPLNGSEYDDIKVLALKAQDREDQEMIDAEGREEEMEVEMEGNDDKKLMNDAQGLQFIDLNGPIRLRDQTVVRPQDINSVWLKNKLESAQISADVEDVLLILKIDDPSEREKLLFSVLGPLNLDLLELLNKNSEIVYWYHKLSNSETVEDRNDVLTEISERRIRIEDLQDLNSMNQDLPNLINVSRIGRPKKSDNLDSVKLPEGSTKTATSLYDQYDIEGRKQETSSTPLVAVTELPQYMHSSFTKIESFNIIQSAVIPKVIYTDDNVLLCAPTGAGKTNIALAAILKCLHSNGRAVYIAPMKALVQEVVNTLQTAMPEFQVQEVSGDETVSKLDLYNADVLVATPEKWDVITSKPVNYEYLQTVQLIVLDEIHLLNDETRGGILETLILRHKRMLVPPRLLALSATLPNYTEVAEFINANTESTFYFGSEYRPVPLNLTFVGLKSSQLIKQRKENDEVLIEKVTESLNAGKQILVFVQSRKGTSVTKNLLLNNVATQLSADEVATHHAGLNKIERGLAEEEFRLGRIKVLVCTSTLAWGVNLPASVVIIKDTQYYDPVSEDWKTLKLQDVVQILGRAGRPGYDTTGHGIILTTKKYLPYFASVATTSLFAQSFLMNRIISSINAEIVLCTIRSLDEAVEWIQQTFWYIRALNDPENYGRDSIVDIAHSVLTELAKQGAVKYAYPAVSATYKGFLASNFYISPKSVAIYTAQLKPWLTEIDLIRVFAQSHEYSSLFIRRGESIEIERLASLCPIPIRDDLSKGSAKVCILLQAYISRLNLQGLSLSADMVYIAQNASRLFRAIFEICVSLKWQKVALMAHRMYMMVDLKQWFSGMSPLRQFKDCPPLLIKKAEKSLIPFTRFLDLNTSEIQQILKLDKSQDALTVHTYLSRLPRFNINATIRPLSTSLVELSLEFITKTELLEPSNFELVIGSIDEIVLHESRVKLVANTKVRVPILLTEPYPSFVFVHLVSEKWLHATSTQVIDLRSLKAPSKVAVGMALDDSMEIDNNESFVDTDNPFGIVQRAIFPLLKSDRNALICMPLCCDHSQAIKAAVHGRTVIVIPTNANKLQLEGVEFVAVSELEIVSRSRNSLVQKYGTVDTFILTNLETVSEPQGFVYELCVTRLKQAVNSRFVGLSFPTTSAYSLAKWLNVSKHDAANFAIVSGVTGSSVQVNSFNGSPVVSFLGLNLNKSKRILVLVPEYYDLKSIRNCISQHGYTNTIVTSTPISHKLYDYTVVCDAEHFTNSTPFNNVFAVVSSALTESVVFANDTVLYSKAVSEPIPVESSLVPMIADAIISNIVEKSISSPQEAVNWLSKTFLYQRLVTNPCYYQAEHLQDWISEAVESAFEYLAMYKFVNLDPETLEVSPNMAAHIVSKYGIWARDLIENVDVHEIISTKGADRFEYTRIMDARIDFAYANNDLIMLLHAVDQRQAIFQKVDLGSSPLMQIPHITETVVAKCHAAEIYTVHDFVSIEDDELRSSLLGFGMEDSRMLDVANFANNYPIVDIRNCLLENGKLTLVIERDISEDDEVQLVAPQFNGTSKEKWILVVADNEKQVIKMTRLEITEPEISVEIDDVKSAHVVWLLCDSYLDADKEFTI